MIHVDWVDPNFEVEVQDLDGIILTEIHSSPDEAALRARLDRRVAVQQILSVRSVRPYDFARWCKRAERARRAAQEMYDANKIEEWEPKSAVWSDLKPYLIQLFHRKCAYCESSFDHVHWGDVEHYRPKKKVTDENGVEVVCAGKVHPGYFWVAYDPTNLLPSCTLCNQALAKMNRFPIAGVRASTPADSLTAEQPLLLHPYEHNPSTDLRFVATVGTVAGCSPRGEASRRTYRLNREALVERRRERQNYVRKALRLAFANERPEEMGEIRRQCREGECEFSKALLAEVDDYYAKMGVVPS